MIHHHSWKRIIASCNPILVFSSLRVLQKTEFILEQRFNLGPTKRDNGFQFLTHNWPVWIRHYIFFEYISICIIFFVYLFISNLRYTFYSVNWRHSRTHSWISKYFSQSKEMFPDVDTATGGGHFSWCETKVRRLCSWQDVFSSVFNTDFWLLRKSKN